MNASQLAHLWANKSRPSAKASHFYFEGDVIYSYGSHFPIARHYKGIVLFTTGRYSNSTAKHISRTSGACHHLTRFNVENVMEEPSGKDVKSYAKRIETAATLLSRARDPQFHLEQLKRIVDEANLFCETFKFKTRFSMPDENTLAGYREKSKVAAQKKAVQTRLRNERIERENAKAIQKWLAGEQNSLGWNVHKVYLRARHVACDGWSGNKPDYMALQTSKGASVPLSDAERAFRFIMLKRQTGWHRNGETFKVGEFQLDEVTPEYVKAGCHRIEWNEIERFAKTQNWL